MNLRRNFLNLLTVLLAAAAPVTASHAQGYPAKPIRLIVPFAAGSTSDIVARQISPRLSELLGQSVVVENRPGGGGTVATEAVAKMPADGYNILMASNAQFVLAPVLYGSKLKYQPEGDFTVLGAITKSPSLVLVSTVETAPHSMSELIGRMKSTPSSFSSTGTGSLTHLGGELLATRIGAKATHVPYRGSGQSLMDVVTGEVLFAIDSPAAAAPLLRSGRLKALAVASGQRIENMKDIPTLAEVGVKDVNVYGWFALFAPAGLPRDVAERLRGEVRRVASEQALKQRLLELNLEPFVIAPTELEKIMRQEQSTWSKIVTDANIQMPQ